jgi:Protein of unknown function (DUF4199)
MLLHQTAIAPFLFPILQVLFFPPDFQFTFAAESMSRELKYGAITGVVILIWMILIYAFHWQQDILNNYADYVTFLILAIGIYILVFHKREKENGGVISFKQAFQGGMSVSFVAALLIGAFLMLYVESINPNYVNDAIKQATDYYKSQSLTQQQIDNNLQGIKAWYSPFGQFTYGIGTTMLAGLLISLVVAAVMKRPENKTANA